MDDRMEKQPAENQLDAARGIPIKPDGDGNKQVSSADSSEAERLDDRIRKAGI